ncbi:MAG: nitrilase [Actinobacteria bacterium RBG_13_35_12]|uniref:Nitrilase n=1 Tax=Candidatus Sediminicultor quintus TaxID=1797291 RepID=A0A1F5AGI5_9BACT|nr:MAG: nitrilase [Actinobacteria bacterium RBG_13_35_12]OGD17603.1 MAG: nitrilase [Candidatus Atribacteria bacterium RBG_19FT_COMBO_35_14]
MEFLIEKWFNRKISLDRIEKYFKQLQIKKRKLSKDINPEDIRVSCVERQIYPVNSLEKYIDMLCGFVDQAAKENSRLIVFPEYNFFDLFGFIPGFSFINQILNKKAIKNKDKEKDRGIESHLKGNNYFLTAIFKGVAKPVEAGVKKIVSLLAKEYGIHIYTGSYILKEKEEIYNAGSLFGPDGNLIGTQKKMHLTDFEVKLGIKRGNKMEVYSLPFGKVVCPICMDATYFETFRIAREMGVDMVILPIANLEEYSTWKALRGIWPRVQESYLYGFKSSLNGWIAGMHFTGKAGIFAPLSMTEKKDGVLSLSPFYEGNHLITANINMKKLYEAREKAEYHEDKNAEFEKNFIEKTYNIN